MAPNEGISETREKAAEFPGTVEEYVKLGEEMERRVYQSQLLSVLKSLSDKIQLGQMTREGILNRLVDADFSLTEDMSTKTIEQLDIDIKTAIAELSEYVSGIPNIASSVNGKIQNVVTDKKTERELTGDLETDLDSLSNDQYFSVERINEALMALEGVDVSIPEDEIARLKGLLPKKLCAATIQKLKRLKLQTRDNQAPVVMQVPSEVVVDGAKVPFTPVVLAKIMTMAANVDGHLLKIRMNEHEMKNNSVGQFASNGRLRAWSSAPISNSEHTPGMYKKVEFRKTLLGEGVEVSPDFVMVASLAHTMSGKSIVSNPPMAIDQEYQSGYNFALSLGHPDDRELVFRPLGSHNDPAVIGASFEIR